jgi:hypothetical protein
MKKPSSNAYCPGCGAKHPDRERTPVVPAELKYCASCEERTAADEHARAAEQARSWQTAENR